MSQGPQTIERWIRDISDLHQSKPPVSVVYHRPMPEIDVLMQEWPFEVESLLVSFSVHMTQSSLNKSNHTVLQEIFI